VRLIPNLKPRPPKAYLGLMVEIDFHQRLAARRTGEVQAEGPGVHRETIQPTRTSTLSPSVSTWPTRTSSITPYQRRLLLTRLLILCAALTALIGLASFVDQLPAPGAP